MFGKHVEGILKYSSWILNRLKEVDFIQVYAGNKQYGGKYLSRPEKGVEFPPNAVVLKHTKAYSLLNRVKSQSYSIQQTINALSLADDINALGFVASCGRSTTKLKRLRLNLGGLENHWIPYLKFMNLSQNYICVINVSQRLKSTD